MNEDGKRHVIYIFLFCMLVFMLGSLWTRYQDETRLIVLANDNPIEYEPIPPSTPTPTPTPVFSDPVEAYIYEVFGEYYDKAMLLLRGNEVCGGENKTLDPYAVNENKRDDGTVWSRDRGIFQINDLFHPLTDEQAFDYRQNIDYAFRMFVNDNYTFSKRWTAGDCLGI